MKTKTITKHKSRKLHKPHKLRKLRKQRKHTNKKETRNSKIVKIVKTAKTTKQIMWEDKLNEWESGNILQYPSNVKKRFFYVTNFRCSIKYRNNA